MKILNEEGLSKIKILSRVIKLMKAAQYDYILTNMTTELEIFTLIDEDLNTIVNVELP